MATPDPKAQAFQSLMETTRTILTIASGILAAYVGFMSQLNAEKKISAWLSLTTVALLSIAVVASIWVLLRAVNALVEDAADVHSDEFRFAYFTLLSTFLLGLILGGISVAAAH